MLCARVQLSSPRGRPEADGVGFHGGNPLTYFHSPGCLCRHMGLLKIYAISSDVFLMYNGVFSESQWSVGEVQGRQSGRTVGPDQFLWLQHPNLCPSCQFAWQIPHNYEGTNLTFKHSSVIFCVKLQNESVYIFFLSHSTCFLSRFLSPVRRKHDRNDLVWPWIMGCWLTLVTVVLMW